MTPMTVTLEREIKLRFPDADAAREAVQRAGATPVRSRRFQEDCLLDTADDSLRAMRCVLRVRIESGKSYLTFKGPPVAPSIMKIRDELETLVGDGPTLIRILEQLGFRVWFRYEKYREEFALNDVIIAVDETPVGTFVEIEGGERAIEFMARALGRCESDYVLDSYRGLFLQRRERLGFTGADMMFADEWSQHSS